MKRLFNLGAFLSSMLFVASCGSQYDTILEGERLPSLTKVTETADSECPFGGDEDGLFFYALDMAKTGHYDIYKKDKPTSKSAIQMTDLGTTGFAYFPKYNKTTDKIVFCMGYKIYTMPVSKGKALTQVTSTNTGRDNHPCFNPKGNLIAYDRVNAINGYYYNSSSEIWLKNLQSGENILLGKGIFPTFSPDGKKIAFAKFEQDKSQIWIMDVDGENVKRITDNNSLQFSLYPCFSPDGEYIVFVGKENKSDNEDLYIVSIEGGNLTRLTISKSKDTHPYWSTDGYIYFTSDRGGKKADYNIWRFRSLFEPSGFRQRNFISY